MRNCEWCGQEFAPAKPSRRFCSNECSGFATAASRGQRGRVEFTCTWCGRKWQDYASNKRQYCSEGCSRLASRRDRPTCEVCGNPVRLMRNRYCSKSCSNKARPRPGVTSLSGLYQRTQKANPEPSPCALCGREGKHRHHSDYGKPNDVTWLCTKCHRRLHHLGKKRSELRVRPDKVSIL